MKLCECGCGEPTNIIPKDDPRRGTHAGEYYRFRVGHQSRLRPCKGYPTHGSKANRQYTHRLRAERALGRPLPLGAEVHHVTNDRSIAAPLVICQDNDYHKLLHFRARIKRLGGNPNTDRWCSECRQLKAIDDFYPSRTRRSRIAGVYGVCRPCARLRGHRQYAARVAPEPAAGGE